MKIFLDSANMEQIKEAHSLGVLAGVTTNPSLVAKEGADFKQRLAEICEIVKGSVSAEVISEDAPGMLAEAEDLISIAPQITIKVPMTLEGLKAANAFREKGVKTNVTLIFSANQALLAARAGATYVSPFIGRLDDIGQDGMELVRDIADIFDIHGIESQIIAASIRHTIHVTEAARAGAHIATLPLNVLKQMAKHPLTDQGIDKFLSDWRKAQG